MIKKIKEVKKFPWHLETVDSPANQGSNGEDWALLPRTLDAHHAYDDQLLPVWRMVRGLFQKSRSWIALGTSL